jgi:ribosomal protein L1
MARLWEVDGIFGNEYAMEKAVSELKKIQGIELKVRDRRNLHVVISRDDMETRGLVKKVITMAHGFVESDAPAGEYERRMEKRRLAKSKELQERKKRLEKY